MAVIPVSGVASSLLVSLPGAWEPREGTLSHIDQMTTLVDYRVGCVCVF